MTTLAATSAPVFSPSVALRRLWATNWPLTLTALASLALLVAAAGLALVDPRLIAGAPAWVKPMKLAISTAVYSLTLVWMLGYVKDHPRLVAAAGMARGLGVNLF